MNPPNQPTPREELEMRLTALLMGELPPEEATAVREQMAADPQLAALYLRLHKAMELLKEASALPEQPAPPTPVQLSIARRERLLAHFQTAPPKPAVPRKPVLIVPKPRRDWSWAILMGLAAALVAMIGFGLAGVTFTSKVSEPPDFTAEGEGHASAFAARVITDNYKEGIPAGHATATLGGSSENAYALNPPTLSATTANSSSFAWQESPKAATTSSVAAITTANIATPTFSATSILSASEEAKARPMLAEPGGASGTVILSGANTYTGTTTINAGTLSIGNAGSSTNYGTISGANGRTGGTVVTGSGKLMLDSDASMLNRGAAKPGQAGAYTGGGTTFTGGVVMNGTLSSSGATTAPGAPAVVNASGASATQNVFVAGGTSGTSPAVNPADYPFVAQGLGAGDGALTLGSGGVNTGGSLGRAGGAITMKTPKPPMEAAAAGALAVPAQQGASELTVTAGKTLSLAGTGRLAMDNAPPAAGEDFTTGVGGAGGAVARSDDFFSKNEVKKEQAGAAGRPVEQLLTEGQSFYDTGRLSLAKKRAEQALNSDPNNAAARDLAKKADRAADNYGVAAYNEARADYGNARTDIAWTTPVRGPNAPKPAATPPPAAAAALAPAFAMPVLEPFAKDAAQSKNSLGDPNAPAAPPKQDRLYTVGEGRVTAGKTEAVREKLTENTDVLVTREWKISPDLIPRTPGAGGAAASALAAPVAGAAGAGDVTKGGSGIADRESAKNWLTANGLQFDGNASAIYIVKSGKLIVRNTPDQLDRVESLLPGAKKTKTEEPAKPAPLAIPQLLQNEWRREKAVATPPAIPQPEISTQANAFSTFSLNVSDVSFKLAAASLEKGQMPDSASVRSEEFINAFDYRDPEPAPGAPLAFATERARYPFAQNRDLLRFSVKTAAAGRQAGRPLNVVLLLDKSGSMERADRVNIVREALRVLTAQMQPQDKLSIVTFARTPRLWADGVAGDKAGETIARINEMTPEGGTNLEAALDLGYTTALRHHAVGSISRVVLFTDGAANLGDVNPDALKKKVEAHRLQGVALDCFGIGWEGFNDDLLEELTRHGDGRYGFINTPEEAAENFAAQLAGALRVAAADVKVQVEFNPRRVTAYRQIGYAKHQLTKEQFRDNTVDAAEIGAAESGNALYVVEVDPRGEGDLATVRVRFKEPGTDDYREHEWAVPFTGNAVPLEQGSSALRLAGTASAFSEMLAKSPYAAEVTTDRLLGLINGVPAIYSTDPRPKQLEWMIHQAKSLSGR